jgi:hypothetical protein
MTLLPAAMDSNANMSSSSLNYYNVEDLDSIDDVLGDSLDMGDCDDSQDGFLIDSETFDRAIIDEVLDEMYDFTNADDPSSSLSPSSYDLVTDESEVDHDNGAMDTSSSSSSTSSSSSSSLSSPHNGLYCSNNYNYNESDDDVVTTPNAQDLVIEAAMKKLDECMRRTAETRKLIERTAALDAMCCAHARGGGGVNGPSKNTPTTQPVSSKARPVSPQSPSKPTKKGPIKAAKTTTKKRRLSSSRSSSKEKSGATAANKKKTSQQSSALKNNNKVDFIRPPKMSDMLMPVTTGVKLDHIRSLLEDCSSSLMSTSTKSLSLSSSLLRRSTSTSAATAAPATADFLRNHKMQRSQQQGYSSANCHW